MQEEGLETKVQENLDLGRIARTAIGYGIVGGTTPNPEIFAPACALVGCAAAAYDEIKGAKLDLFTPALATFVGGLIGSMFTASSELTVYTGASLGAAFGTYKSLKYRKK